MTEDLKRAAVAFVRRLLSRDSTLADNEPEIAALAVHAVSTMAWHDAGLAADLVALVPRRGPGPHAAHVNGALADVGVSLGLRRCMSLLDESPTTLTPPEHPWSNGGPPTTRPAPAAPPVEGDR